MYGGVMSETLIHFPIYIGDALKKFIEFPTLEERGAWLSITVALIQNNGALPDDETLFFKCLIFNEQNKQVLKQVLSKCLIKTDRGWESEEVNLLINKQKDLRDKRKEFGRRGGLKKPKSKQKLKQSESESESESKAESKAESKREKTKEKLPLPDWLPKQDWNDYLDMRELKNKYPTDRAKQMVIVKLDELRSQSHCPSKALQQSIINNWTSVFATKESKQETIRDDLIDFRDSDEYKELANGT